MSTITLAVIAKDEVEHIRRIITDYSKYFDAIDIAVDDPLSFEFLVKTYPNVNFYKYEWIKDFANKRNFLSRKCTSDYYFRLDTDDKIRNPENIRDVVEKARLQNIDVILTWYEYAKDPHGNVHAAHWRETIIRTKSKCKWNKRIHENIIPENTGDWRIVLEKGIVIEHMLDAHNAQERMKRNLDFLTEEYARTKDSPDPRTLAYLGRMLYPMGRIQEAKVFLEEHIRLSGWDEDKMKSWCMLADILSDLGENEQAIGACYEALNERVDFPDPYLKMSEIYNKMGNWAKSIHWGLIGLKQEPPLSTTLFDPSSYTWRPSIVMAVSYLMSNDVVNAKKFFDIAAKLVPSLDWIVKNKPLFEQAVEQKEFVDRFIGILKFLRIKQPSLVPAMFSVVPDCFKGHELIVQLKHDLLPKKLWDSDTIEIYCGNAWEEWAAPSVINGIGGSEEAVIYLSRELVKLGWKVTVYNTCGEMAGNYEGVEYKPHYEFNFKDDHNIVISWRHNIFSRGFSAKKRYVWLHDVMPKTDYPASKLEEITKVITLSNYHKEIIGVPEDKSYVSSNGVNLKDFALKETPKRNPHRMIYTSSYDRGIEHLLKRWKEVKDAVPDAELHLFYGWNTYDEMMKIGRRPKAYRDYMTKLMLQDGIHEHGRVGHKQLIKEFYKSGIYVYPTHFEEISCISAMKAQECGCVPVVFDYAALKETVKSGIKIEGKATDEGAMDKYITALIDVLKDTEKQEKLRSEIPKGIFGWDEVAKKWDNDLLRLTRRSYKDLKDYANHYVTTGEFHTSNFTQDGEIMVYPRYKFVLDNLKKHYATSFLDVGSSDGALCFMVNKTIGIPTEGIEADLKATYFAVDYAKKNNLKCSFHNCLIEEFNSKEPYSAASALEIIEHVLDPKKFLEAIERNVVDGGIIIICTPDKNGYYGEKNFNEQHINHFTKESLEELIGKDRIVEWANTPDFLQVVYKK